MCKTLLFQNWYEAQTPSRRLENEFTLAKNLQNPSIDKVVLWQRAKLPPWTFKYNYKLELFPHADTHHPTFTELFSLANSYDPESIKLIANTDIYFPNFLRLDALLNQEVPLAYALSRWERTHREWQLYKIRTLSRDSQDVWAFKGLISTKLILNSNFRIGYLGCDNRLAYEMQEAGYTVINPASQCRAYHVHFSQQRFITRRNPDNVIKPPYLFVSAT